VEPARLPRACTAPYPTSAETAAYRTTGAIDTTPAHEPDAQCSYRTGPKDPHDAEAGHPPGLAGSVGAVET
jgi:hypothetical protein